MQQNTMEHNAGHGNVYMTILTIVLLYISKVTLSDVAAMSAIFAGVTTGGYNIYKFYKEKNNGNPKPKKRKASGT